MIRACCLLLVFTGLHVELPASQVMAQTNDPIIGHSGGRYAPHQSESATAFSVANQADELNRPATRVGAADLKFRKADLQRKLTKPSQSSSARDKSSSVKNPTGSFTTTLVVLGLVIALIFIVAKFFRKHAPLSLGGVPLEAIEVLGKRHLDQRQTIHLIRCGSRILIVGSSTTGLTTLAEFTDPVEVDYLAGLCKRDDTANGVVDSFKSLFNKQQSAAMKTHSPKRSTTRFSTNSENVVTPESALQRVVDMESLAEKVHG